MIPGFLYSEISDIIGYDPAIRSWQIEDAVMDWFRENDINVYEQEFITTNNKKEFGIIFDNDEDALAFKLRWL